MSSTPMKLEDVWKGKHWFTRLTTWSKRRLYTALARASRALFACSTLRGTLGRERQSGAVTDCPKLGHAGPLFKMNSPSSFYLFICSYKNQPNSNLPGELCRGWRFLILHRSSSRKLCDGVKGPTLCKIHFNAFHNNARFLTFQWTQPTVWKVQVLHSLLTLLFTNCIAQMCSSKEKTLFSWCHKGRQYPSQVFNPSSVTALYSSSSTHVESPMKHKSLAGL